MKTRLLFLLTLLVVLISSCAQDEMLEKRRLAMAPSQDVTFTASFEDETNDSRTYIEEDKETSKLYLRWTKGDEISIFRGTTLNQRYQFKGETGDNSGSFKLVPSDDFVSSNELEESRNYAFYPYDEHNKISEKGELTVTLPATQTYAENSFGPGANGMIALTKNTGDVDLKFKNIGGYFKFKFYGDDLTIKSVTLKGNNGEKLAGKAGIACQYGDAPIVTMAEEATETLTLNCGAGIKVGTTKEEATEFWFVLPPTKFTKGFTITVTDVNDGTFTKTTEKVFEIKRNTIKPISAMKVETVVDWEAIYAKERAALIDLYNATDGDNWSDNTNWCSDKPVSEWYGVKTESNRVTCLYLGFNELSGELPESITKLNCLRVLDMQGNQLSGVIPEFIGNLNELTYLRLNQNKFTGGIPASIWNLKNLKELNLNVNLLSGTLDESIGKLTTLEYLDLAENQLSGVIPESITNLKNLRKLILSRNNFIGVIPEFIGELTNLEWLFLNRNGLTGKIPYSVGNLNKLSILCLDKNKLSDGIPNSICNLSSLQSLQLGSNDLSGEIPNSIGKLVNVNSIDLKNNKLSGEIPSSIENCRALEYLNVTNNKLTGKIPEWLLTWPNLSFYFDGNLFDNTDDLNQSTDYSKDGEVMVLQTATVGKGINLVFLGDAFIDTDMETDGLYEQTMNSAMEELFSVEPYTSLRNRFNVYSVKVISASNRSKDKCRINGDNMKCYEYVLKVENLKTVDTTDDLMISVIYNPTTNLFSQSYCLQSLGNTGFISFTRVDALLHETGGHGIAKLLDEYSNTSSTLPESEQKILDDNWNLYGWGANIDWRNDINTIKWSHFLNDARYKEENIGIYEGGYAGYKYGVYRPTENSIMLQSDLKYFNAPSREQIYKRIMQLSEGSNWKYDYEEFVKFDEKNRNAASRSTSKILTEAEIREYAKKHCPPIIVKGTWRDTIKNGKNNIIVPLR